MRLRTTEAFQALPQKARDFATGVRHGQTGNLNGLKGDRNRKSKHIMRSKMGQDKDK